MSNINKEIKDFYCNGFFGRRYDLTDAVIEGEGEDWLVIRLTDNSVATCNFASEEQKNVYLPTWLDPIADCCY